MLGSGRLRSLVAPCVGLALWSVPSAGLAERAAWDQERVTAIAQELASAIKDVQVTFKKQPSDLMVGQRRAYYRVIQDLRVLRNEARHLASVLRKGKGYDETLPVYERMQVLRRNAAENGRNAMLMAPTLDAVAKARDLLIRLAPYYSDDWSPPGDT